MGWQSTTRLKIPFHAISLTKDTLRELLEIVSKAKTGDPSAYVNFEIEGHGETIAAESIDAIVNSKLPRDLTNIHLLVWSQKKQRQIQFSVWNVEDFTIHKIEVEATDTDWVNARVKEMEDFISDHRNFHWVFQNWAAVISEAIVLGALIAISLKTYIGWNVGAGIISGFFYVPIVRKLFPAVILDTERQSSIKKTRKILAYIVPAIFITLIANLLLRLIWR